jgi:hypothetical protein
MDGSWDIISVYVERKDLESIYIQTAPPKSQSVVGTAIGIGMATGPLPNVTVPLGSASVAPEAPAPAAPAIHIVPDSMNTAPVTGYAMGMRGHNTRPLYPVEVETNEREAVSREPSINGGNDSNNGHRPIEGRAVRGGESRDGL